MYAIRSYYALHELEAGTQAEEIPVATPDPSPEADAVSLGEGGGSPEEPDWEALHAAVTGREREKPEVIPAGASSELKQAGTDVVAEAELMPHFPPEGRRSVITSYSIHYTKLYEAVICGGF